MRDFDISINIKINKPDGDFFVSKQHQKAVICALFLNLKVLPLDPETKKPMESALPTTDLDKIEQWWKTNPNLNFEVCL